MRKFLALICTFLTTASSVIGGDVAYPDVTGRNQASRFPFSMAGQLIFASGRHDYQGSGTTISQRSVLTAAHNLWDAETGWSTNVEFNQGRYGRRIESQVFARRLFVFGGYAGAARHFGADSVRAFSRDLGGLRFSTPPADGAYAGWSADSSVLTGDAYNIALGYGAATHSGDFLLSVTPKFNFVKTRGGFLENDSLSFEEGMSGGPVFAEIAPGDLRIVAVIVAGSDDPPSGGVRAINQDGAKFILGYLHY